MSMNHAQVLTGGALSLIALSAPAFLPTPVSGQSTPTYRIIDLTDDNIGHSSRAWGMNDQGQVVGEVQLGPDDWRAFVWLPENAYGGSKGMNLLSSFGGVSGLSVARDINEDGKIVGVDGTMLSGDAYFWDIGSSGMTFGVIGDLALQSNSRAYAINENPMAQVVGSFNDINGIAGVSDLRGFHWVEGAATTTTLQPALPDALSAAYDLQDNTGTELTVGYAERTNFCNDQDCINANCKPGRSWTNSNPGPILGYNNSGSLSRSQARNINFDENVVGLIGSLEGDCRIRASYWNDLTDDPIRLPYRQNQFGGDIFSDNMIANSISNRNVDGNKLMVVGEDIVAELGLLWTSTPGTSGIPDENDWDVLTLCEDIPGGCDEVGNGCGNDEWKFIEAATAINDEGWIVGFGFRDVNINGQIQTRQRAFLLVPFTCIGDFVGNGLLPDGRIDTQDLLVLLGAWGDCDGPGCLGDMNCDGNVDTQDLLSILVNWGDCGVGGESVPETVQDCLNKFPAGSLELQKCLEIVGGSS